MTLYFLLPTASKVLAIVGLSLDIYGIFKLFEIEPEPIYEVEPDESWEFYKQIGDEMGYTYSLVLKLNMKVKEFSGRARRFKNRSKRFKKLILWGFSLQIISILLSFFHS